MHSVKAVSQKQRESISAAATAAAAAAVGRSGEASMSQPPLAVSRPPFTGKLLPEGKRERGEEEEGRCFGGKLSPLKSSIKSEKR